MEDVGVDGQRDVGAVVHRKQRAIPRTRLRQHLQGREFLARLQRRAAGLVAELDDVDAPGQRRVGELGEVAACGAGVRAEVKAGGVEAGAAGFGGKGGHSGDRTRELMWRCPHGSPRHGLRGSCRSDRGT